MWGATDYIQSVTYKGVEMLRAGTVQQGSAHVYIYYLPNPAPGTNPISIAFTGGFNAYSGGAISFTDVDQLRPIRLVSSCSNFAQIAQVGAGIVNYSNTGLATGTNYSYRVRGYNLGGDSSYSNTATANTSTPPLAAPLNLAATTISTTEIDLTWTDNSGNEDGFKIERCQGSGCTNFAEIDQVSAGVVSYSNTGLTSGATYIYRVRAFNAGGNSAYSNTSSATTSVTAPAAPLNLSASTLSSTRIDLTWTDNSNNEDGFKIERCQGSGCTNFTQIDQVAAGIISYSNTGLTSGMTYTYRLRAFNGGGDSSYSNTASATTSTPPPAAPLNLAATAVSSTGIDLTWTDNSSNEDGFKIERCQGSGCTNFAQIDQVGSGIVNYSNTGLATGTNYSYRVRAYNVGGDSSYSNSASATTSAPPPAPPAAPLNLVATTVSSTRIDLTWTDNSSNEDGFQIERSTDGSTFTQIATVGANVTTYSNTGITCTVFYYYRVRAYNAIGNSAYSNTVKRKVPQCR
jgi:titin